jgi:hypothetical protein
MSSEPLFDFAIYQQPVKPNRIKILTGQIFHRLTVLGFLGIGKFGMAEWLCRCTCGNICAVLGSHMSRGLIASCGCLHQENSPNNFVTHGESRGNKRTPEFQAYKSAKSRCNNPNTLNYANYGGRGIEFRFKSFDEFLAAVGRRPSPQHSLDRKTTMVTTNREMSDGQPERNRLTIGDPAGPAAVVMRNGKRSDMPDQAALTKGLLNRRRKARDGPARSRFTKTFCLNL